MLGGAGPWQGQYSSICLSPVHVCEWDVVLLVTAPKAHGWGLISVQTLLPLGVGWRVQRYALHVFHVQVKVFALWWLVLLTVEEGHVLESRMQVLTHHLDDLKEGGTHLGVVLPTHLHQVVSGWGQQESEIPVEWYLCLCCSFYKMYSCYLIIYFFHIVVFIFARNPMKNSSMSYTGACFRITMNLGTVA